MMSFKLNFAFINEIMKSLLALIVHMERRVRILLVRAAFHFLNYSRLASLIRWEKTDYLSVKFKLP